MTGYCPFCDPEAVRARQAILGPATEPGWYVFHSETGYAVAGPYPDDLQANIERHRIESHERQPGIRRCYDVMEVQA